MLGAPGGPEKAPRGAGVPRRLLETTFLRVQESALPRLREWLRGLAQRRDELRESYAAEGTRHERFFLLRDAEGPVLLLVGELEDGERGRESFLRSRRPLAVEFKRLIQEIGAGDPQPECLYDSALLLDASEAPSPAR